MPPKSSRSARRSNQRSPQRSIKRTSMDSRAISANMSQMNVSSSSNGMPMRGSPRFHPGMEPEELQRKMDEYKEWMEEDNKIPPSPPPYMDRELLLGSQAASREAQKDWLRSGQLSIRMAIVGLPKHCSSTPLHQLERISFSEMMIRKTHLGKFLLCRSAGPSVRAGAVQLAVEDPDGIIYGLSIYNFPTMFHCPPRDADFLFPIGVIFAIREPTFKPAAQAPYPILRVDSPSDIAFLNPNDPILAGVSWRTGTLRGSPQLPSTVEGWKECGNELFKASQWLPAAIAYTHGLQLDPEATVLYSNRSEAYLRLEFYSGALADARQVTRTPGVSNALLEKVLIREAKAEYARGRYEVALQKFKEWEAKYAQGNSVANEIATWVSRAERRGEESRTGKYDWARIFLKAQDKPHLDIADYQGPIKVRPMENRGAGRGVVATKDVAVGELLLVAKPLVAIFDLDLSEKEVTLNIDFLAGVDSEPSQSQAMARAIHKIYGNPDLHDQVFQLYAGSDYPTPPPAYPPPQPTEAIAINPLAPTVDIDVSRLEAIFSHNAFSAFPLRMFNTKPKEEDEEDPTSLYLLPSLFNHSCVANSSWVCFGDTMIIRATAHIKAGDEITFAYTDKTSYLARKSELEKHMVPHCDCWLCEADRNDGEDALEVRHKLVAEILRDWKQYSLAEARTMERKLAATYARSRGPVRPSLAFVQHAKAEALRRTRSVANMRDAIEEDIKSLESFGYVVRRKAKGKSTDENQELPIITDQIPSTTTFERPVMTILRIVEQFLILDDDTNAEMWLRAALWIVDTSIGGEKALFMLMIGPALEAFGMYEYAMNTL